MKRKYEKVPEIVDIRGKTFFSATVRRIIVFPLLV